MVLPILSCTTFGPKGASLTDRRTSASIMKKAPAIAARRGLQWVVGAVQGTHVNKRKQGPLKRAAANGLRMAVVRSQLLSRA